MQHLCWFMFQLRIQMTCVSVAVINKFERLTQSYFMGGDLQALRNPIQHSGLSKIDTMISIQSEVLFLTY